MFCKGFPKNFIKTNDVYVRLARFATAHMTVTVPILVAMRGNKHLALNVRRGTTAITMSCMPANLRKQALQGLPFVPTVNVRMGFTEHPRPGVYHVLSITTALMIKNFRSPTLTLIW